MIHGLNRCECFDPRRIEQSHIMGHDQEQLENCPVHPSERQPKLAAMSSRVIGSGIVTPLQAEPLLTLNEGPTIRARVSRASSVSASRDSVTDHRPKSRNRHNERPPSGSLDLR